MSTEPRTCFFFFCFFFSTSSNMSVSVSVSVSVCSSVGSCSKSVCLSVCLCPAQDTSRHGRHTGSGPAGRSPGKAVRGRHSPASSSAGRPPRGRAGHCLGSGCAPAEYHKTILLYHMCLSAGRHDPVAGAPGHGSVGLLLEAGEGREGGQGLRQALRHGLDLLVRRAALEGGGR